MHVSTKKRVLQDKAGALKSVAKIEDRSDRIEKCDKQDRSDSTEKLGWEVVSWYFEPINHKGFYQG